jgi:hypothetical protein
MHSIGPKQFKKEKAAQLSSPYRNQEKPIIVFAV